jgi:opacity protein-like surface antigen
MVIVTGLLLWSGPARAQDPPFVLFGPQVGVSKSPDADANLIFGAALRMRFLSALAVEGSVSYREDDFAGDALTVRSWPLQVTGMLYPLPFVYGAMGAGWYMTTFDFDPDVGFLDDDTQSEFGWHFGGGLELPLGSVVRLAGDIRYVFIDYDFDAVPGSDEIDSDFYMATAGLLFRL